MWHPHWVEKGGQEFPKWVLLICRSTLCAIFLKQRKGPCSSVRLKLWQVSVMNQLLFISSILQEVKNLKYCLKMGHGKKSYMVFCLLQKPYFCIAHINLVILKSTSWYTLYTSCSILCLWIYHIWHLVLLPSPLFDSVRVVDFWTSGGWWKFELVRVLDFRACGGWGKFWLNEGAGFSTQVRRLLATTPPQGTVPVELPHPPEWPPLYSPLTFQVPTGAHRKQIVFYDVLCSRWGNILVVLQN